MAELMALSLRSVLALALGALSACEVYLPDTREGAAAPPAAAALIAVPQPPSAAADKASAALPQAVPPEPELIGAARLEHDYPLFGLAVYMQAQIYAEPSMRATVLGYMRRGTRFRATRGVAPAPNSGCETRWHELHMGGWVCTDRSVLIGATPPEFASTLPSPPTLTAALPYDYEKAMSRNTPLYARRPTDAEASEFADWLVHNPAAADKLAHAAVAPPLPAPTKSSKKLPAKKQPPAPALPKLPDYVRLLLQPGYYVSVDGQEPDPDGRTFLRTVRGDVLHLRNEIAVHASVLHGTVVHGGMRELSQLALVSRAGAHSFMRDPISGRLQPSAAAMTLLEPVVLTPERVNGAHGELAVAEDGRLIPTSALRAVPHTPRPAFVPHGARYIAVQLSSQTLVAYDGDKPVYATLVSTGKEGFETPTGIYRIQHKHISATMDGEVGADDMYRIEDVPWTMYFSGSLALHAAFWHERFGQQRSHGCVNLAPLDAHWLFDWASPVLPPGYHGVNSTRENPGTYVVITQ
jgi:hypothetical protein